MSILLIGCGDIGLAVAYALKEKGYDVAALKRNPPKDKDGIQYIKADITDKKSLENLNKDYAQVLYIVSPDSSVESAYKSVFDEGLTNALEYFSQSSFTFISSTVVYGQTSGEWVDESSIMIEGNMRSKVLLRAEALVSMKQEDNTIIRLSGIYGRGGNRILKKLQAEEAFPFQPPYYTNRIHKEDCVGVIVFIMIEKFKRQLEEQVYIATDSNPLSMYEVASLVALENTLPSPEKKYLEKDANQNKRISNKRIIALGYRFKYPSFI